MADHNPSDVWSGASTPANGPKSEPESEEPAPLSTPSPTSVAAHTSPASRSAVRLEEIPPFEAPQNRSGSAASRNRNGSPSGFDSFIDGVAWVAAFAVTGLVGLDLTRQILTDDQGHQVVEPLNGNIAYNSPVPDQLKEHLTFQELETLFVRYSAATCAPDDFKDQGFRLRQDLPGHEPRTTELFIVITMYNEDYDLFLGTMRSVMKNIAFICKNKSGTLVGGTETWGEDAWKKIVVCIVSDGRAMANARTLEVLTVMGIYQEQTIVNEWDRKDVVAHIWEYTTQVCLDEKMELQGIGSGLVPVQVIFCLKEQNQQKINSHRWFFNAFGPLLKPTVCLLLDVGTIPGPTSLFDLWFAFTDPQVAGACGEITVSTGERGLKLFNPLVAAQNFEYKISNILDKPLESVFGFITVLPGAFSAYRYEALQNDENGEGPLEKYFLGETKKGPDTDIFTANMYLAEDRILCWELVTKRKCAWVLRYVKLAQGATDVPDQLPELILQRRRWLNGSFFAAVHSLFHFSQIYRTTHTEERKFWIHVQVVYQAWSLFLSWFAMANYWIAFVVLSSAMADFFPNVGIRLWNGLLSHIYQGLLLTAFLLAVGNRPMGTKLSYQVTIIGFGLIGVYMTFASYYFAVMGIGSKREAHPRSSIIWLFFWDPLVFTIGLSLLSTVGSYAYAAIIFGDGRHMVTSFVQYILLAPSYTNLFNVYAFANVHDVSWGTRQSPTQQTMVAVTRRDHGRQYAGLPRPVEPQAIDAGWGRSLESLKGEAPDVPKAVDPNANVDYYKTIRTNVLIAWALSNAVLAAGVTKTAEVSAAGGYLLRGYMSFILYSMTILSLVRCIGATMFVTDKLRIRAQRAIKAFRADVD